MEHGTKKGQKGLLPRRSLGGVPHTATCARRCSPLIKGDSLLRVLTRIQSHWQTGILSFAGAATPQILATLEVLGMSRVYTVTLMIGTNDVSREGPRKVMRLHDKMSCILEELRIQMASQNMKADQNATEMNAKVRNLN